MQSYKPKALYSIFESTAGQRGRGQRRLHRRCWGLERGSFRRLVAGEWERGKSGQGGDEGCTFFRVPTKQTLAMKLDTRKNG